MSREQREFEKNVRSLLRGEPVRVDDMLDRWRRLGAKGNRLLAQTLNRSGGWEPFIRWAGPSAEARSLMADLVQFPGISESGLHLLEKSGIDSPAANAGSRRALWIQQAAGREDSGDWVRARDMMLADAEVMEGALDLLEAQPSVHAAEFLGSLAAAGLSRDQDQRVRKALYRLKQQGMAAQKRERGTAVAEKEWWALSENRDPNFQFALCFRFHSAFASSGDLYILRIWEGHEAFPVEQEPGLQLRYSDFLELGQRYAEHISRQTHADIVLRPVPAEHAHYFLRKEISLLPESADPRPLQDFLRFLGAGQGREPFETRSAGPAAEAAFLELPYFQRWMLDPEDLMDFFNEVKRLEEGPIILVGAPQVEQKRAAATAALRKLFDPRQRALWAFAFRKAAYFIQKQDPQAAAAAMAAAASVEDASKEADELDVFRILFERSARAKEEWEKRKQQEAKETSLIMTPDEFARSSRRNPER